MVLPSTGIMYSLILKGTQNIKAIKVIMVCITAIIGVTFLMVNKQIEMSITLVQKYFQM